MPGTELAQKSLKIQAKSLENIGDTAFIPHFIFNRFFCVFQQSKYGEY